jgi:hypothetical protein
LWSTPVGLQDELVITESEIFYWLTMIDDCIKYQKGCEVCQRFRNIQLAPAGVMNSIVKLWPFRGWGLDFIGEIHPRSSKGHQFILVAID